VSSAASAGAIAAASIRPVSAVRRIRRGVIVCGARAKCTANYNGRSGAPFRWRVAPRASRQAKSGR
jgi:hypothetical protein